ncbi:MAG: glutathione S-transferase family protein [Alphaproteobacteria bacterium]|nr:glutathione S-transferase family protein [Alphaproteobacteria bacterium]
MAELTIYLGNKNYSSWSLRAWLAMKQAGLAFDEVVIPLQEPSTKATIMKYSPAGTVPTLRHGELTVWDSLAICEYLADTFPDLGLWPRAAAARAVARSVSAEMHAGFEALRAHLPMNVRSSFPDRGVTPEVQADINRIMAIWRDCRARFGSGGAFLFGDFSIADAMYAPVATRFRTYRIDLEREADAYCEAILALPAMQEWIVAAGNEPMIIDAYEF